jgi:hypothetical protein
MLLHDNTLIQRRLNIVTMFVPGNTEFEKKLVGFLFCLSTFLKGDQPIKKEVPSVQRYVGQCVTTAAKQGL